MLQERSETMYPPPTLLDEDIVRSCGNMNRKSATEMIAPSHCESNNNDYWDPISVPGVPENHYPGGIPIPSFAWGTLNPANSVDAATANTELAA